MSRPVNSRGAALLKCYLLPFFTLFLLLSFSAKAQLVSFPGAEGFGSHASGGRGGMVVEVTNTNDTGVGSFRWAIAQFPDKPVTIVFRVSGTISLKSTLNIKRSNLTIAGQTAPGDGICFKDNSVQINGGGLGGPFGNIIVRYIRFRPGAPVFLGATGLNLENMHDVIIDHCSFSWANEENAAIYDSKNITIQWCISSEGLYNAWHHKGSRSYSGVWGGQYSSLHHNLIAHNNTRTIRYDGSRAHDTAALVDTRNNIVYNSHSWFSCYGGEVEIPGGFSRVNIINCTYKRGPATPAGWMFIGASISSGVNTGTGTWHLEGNKMIGLPADTILNNNNWKGLDLSSIAPADTAYATSDTIFTIPAWAAVNFQSADSSYKLVLNNAGAILPKRDTVDRRIVNETRLGIATGTGSFPNGIPVNVPYAGYPGYGPSIGNGIIDTPSVVGGWPVYNSTIAPADGDHDGMPDAWEICRGFNPADSADRNVISQTGYTNLEDYLNGYLCTTGISNINNAKVKLGLYPNPAHNELTIIYPAAKQGATITIISVVTGQVLSTYPVQYGTEQMEVKTANLVPGGYAILFRQADERISETFIKQ